MDCKRCCYIRWGKHQSGRQRWRCRKCGKTKVRQKFSRRHGLLKRFLVDGDTMAQLAEKYRVHPLTIRNWLRPILDGQPPLKINLEASDEPYWFVTDATHFKRWGCLLITKSTVIKHPLAISFHDKENLSSVLDHLEPLSKLSICGYTTDGKKGLVMAYKQVFPHAKQQRCLVHITMKVQTLLTQHPKLPIAKELSKLVSMLCPITDTISATVWWEMFSEWYDTNLEVLNQKTRKGKSWWYTHKNLRKAARHVLNAADELFVFIGQPNSVSNTNQLEGLFGQRKPALYRHRGLSRKRVANALLWTFHLLNKKH